jgi:ATP-binding protein involved in chromosome partitioning
VKRRFPLARAWPAVSRKAPGGDAHREAERLGVDFLDEIPPDTEIRETSDGGHPVAVSRPDGENAEVLHQIGERALA